MFCERFTQTYNVTTLSGTEKGLLPVLKCLVKTMQLLMCYKWDATEGNGRKARHDMTW